MRTDKFHGGVPTDHLPAGAGPVIHDPVIAAMVMSARLTQATMMAGPTAPGVYVNIQAAGPSAAQAPSTGTWFFTGEAQMGPVGVAIPLTSMTDYGNYLGTRPSYTTAYDSSDEYFHDGGVLAYFSRIVGPAAVQAHLTLVDRAGSPLDTLTVTANGGGVWGNSCTVAVANGSASNTFVITIANSISGQTWVSPDLSSPADAAVWGDNLAGDSPWLFPFVIANLGSATAAPNNNPAVLAATALASGADDIASVSETQWTNALTAFTSDLGPGQVSAAGHTTQAGWEALIAHAGLLDGAGCLVNNRYALCDGPDTATASTVIADAVEAQAAGDPGFGMMLAPWVVIPGVPATSVNGSPVAATRTVPPSALVAALMAANDQTNNAGVPAAGGNGQSTYATGVSQTYSETDRGSLNSAGVSVIRQISGIVQLYGYVSLSTNPAWVSAAFGRERMSLVSQLNTVAQGFAFQQIDGQGHLLSHFGGALAGVCQNAWQEGALYGDNAQQAFSVNVGPQVNTPTTLAAGQLNAVVSVRMSPYAEFVIISVVQYSIAQSIPA